MKEYILYKITGLGVVLLLLCSCIKDHDNTGTTGNGLPVTVTLATRGIGDVQFAQGDHDLSSLRIMGYHSATGTLAFNRLITTEQFTETGSGDAVKRKAEVEIITGDFTVVLIGNENSDPSVSAVLSSDQDVFNLSRLKTLSFSSAAFDEEKQIPMFACYENVQVSGDNSLIVGGTPVTDQWNVKLDRMALRLDITLKLTARQYRMWEARTDAKKNVLTVAGVPKQVYMFPATDNSGSRADRDYSAAVGGPGSVDGPDSDGGYTVSFPRIILPELYFASKGDAAKAALIRLYMKENGNDTSYEARIGYETADDTNYDFTLPRNHYFDIKGTILNNTELELEIGVEGWDDVLVSDMTGNRELRVSAVNVSINENNMARIYFWTNQKEVSIMAKTSEGAGVGDTFYGLTGNDPENFHFDETTGEGYFDIMTDRWLLGQNHTGNYGLILDAGGHKREIRVGVTIPGYLGSTRFVGAFWRNDQVGERLIVDRALRRNWWYAEVIEGQDFIVLAKGKSLDLNLWTDKEPGDAENFPVTGSETFIEDKGHVFFRIGLKDKNNTGRNRYGVVRVTYPGAPTNSYHYIYVRQGEDPDYLMRPGSVDPGTTLTDRTHAVMFSPYNLTSAEFLAEAGNWQKKGGQYLSGHSQIGGSGATVDAGRTNATFTEYPTQAGAYFQWANNSATNIRYAWHPNNPNGITDITDWNNEYPKTSADFWDGPNNLRAAHETCPPGYRRPTDGTTATAVDVNSNIAASEMRQSLWLDPPESTDSEMGNSAWGFYADGFFDRRMIVVSPSGLALSSPSVVCTDPDDYRIAYVGRLFFNEDTNASLFFPAAGFRSNNDGRLSTSGNNGYYLSSSSATIQTGSFMHVSSSDAKNVVATARNSGMNIRCVVDK